MHREEHVKKMKFAGPSRTVGLSMETASCHPSGAKNLKVALNILGKFVHSWPLSYTVPRLTD